MRTSNRSTPNSVVASFSYIKQLNQALKTNYQKNNIISRLFYTKPLPVIDKRELFILPEHLLNVNEIFSSDDLSQAPTRGNRILITGAAETGKTTFTRYLSYVLSLNSTTQDDFSNWRKQFKKIILLSLPHFFSGIEETSDAVCFLFSEHLPSVKLTADYADKINGILEKEDNAGHTLWIIDGYDEMTRRMTLEKNYSAIFNNLLEKKNLILTSQFNLDVINKRAPAFTPTKKLHLGEFNAANVNQYIHNFFINLNMPCPERAEELIDFINANPNLSSVCSLPGSLEWICSAWERKFLSKTTRTLTQCYSGIFNHLAAKFLRSQNRDTIFLEDQDIRILVKSQEFYLALLAWKSLVKGTSACTIGQSQSLLGTDNRPQVLNNLPQLGLLRPALRSVRSIVYKTKTKFYFSHQRLQYYFAAECFCEAFKKRPNDFLPGFHYNPKNYIIKFLYDPNLETLWRFVAGILWEKKETALLDQFFSILSKEPADKEQVVYQKRLFLLCQYEMEKEGNAQTLTSDFSNRNPNMYGRDDFKQLVKQNKFVDNSLFLKEFIDNLANCQAVSRPPKYGKTVIASMIYHFFSNLYKDDLSLFQDLEIWQEGERYQSQKGNFPVIYLSFHDLEAASLKEFQIFFGKMLSHLYIEFRDVLFGGTLDSAILKNQYDEVCSGKVSKSCFAQLLKQMVRYLEKQYNNRVIVIIDEYDKPFLQSIYHNYFEQMAWTLNEYLTCGLKDTAYIKKSFLTGRLDFPPPDGTSGLNILSRYSIFTACYSSHFIFYHHDIFHPSQTMTSCLNDDLENPYSSIMTEGFIKQLKFASSSIKKIITALSYGETIEAPIHSLVCYRTLNTFINEKKINENYFLGILVNMGYVKVMEHVKVQSNFYRGSMINMVKVKLSNADLLEKFKRLAVEWEEKDILSAASHPERRLSF